MDKEQLKKLVNEKIDAAVKASDHPKKFFVTENGRGVVDGGDLYNAVFKDVLGVVKVALADILEELAKQPVPVAETKVSTAKTPAQTREKKK